MAGQAQSRPELQLQQQPAAPPWGELLSFQYFQRLCPPGAGYGYSGGSVQGMRESEFGRLGEKALFDFSGSCCKNNEHRRSTALYTDAPREKNLQGTRVTTCLLRNK